MLSLFVSGRPLVLALLSHQKEIVRETNRLMTKSRQRVTDPPSVSE